MVGEKSQGEKVWLYRATCLSTHQNVIYDEKNNTVFLNKNGHLQNWDEFWLDDVDLSLSGLLEVFFFGNLNWNIF